MFLNPAFAGATNEYRLSLGYRNQWPELPQSFVTSAASFDAYFPEIRSGVGLSALYDYAGAGLLSQLRIQGSYSYAFRITRKISARPALSVGYYRRGVDPDKLIFGDQLTRGSNRSSIEQVGLTKGFFDFSTGFLVYSENFWFGFSALHLNSPNQSLLGEISNLPTYYSVHTGVRVILRKGYKNKIERAIYGAMNLRSQEANIQADIGFYGEFNPMIIGLWYRGLDWMQQNELNYHTARDAIIPMLGVEWRNCIFAYSYDITISNLFGNTGGAHEIGISWEFEDYREPRHKIRILPCPAF